MPPSLHTTTCASHIIRLKRRCSRKGSPRTIDVRLAAKAGCVEHALAFQGGAEAVEREGRDHCKSGKTGAGIPSGVRRDWGRKEYVGNDSQQKRSNETEACQDQNPQTD